MAHEVQDALTGPTYIVISRYSDGEVWFNETKLNASLQDAIYDLDNLKQVIMIEDNKAINVTLEAAELWWAKNGHKCDDVWSVPSFITDNMADQVYAEISGSRYDAACWHSQQVSCNAGRL